MRTSGHPSKNKSASSLGLIFNPGCSLKDNLKLKNMKTVKVIIERNDNGNYQAVPQMNENIAFFGMGKTVEEAMEDLHNSYMEAKEMEPELPEMQFECMYDTASFLQMFKGKMNLADLQTITGINRKQLNHYVTGHSKPSPKTVHRIQEGIKKYAEDLSRVVLV